MPHHIRRARAAQHLAARALLLHGPAHPRARRLLALAARTAARAFDAGHRVLDVHRLISPGAEMNSTTPTLPSPVPVLGRFRREHGDPRTWTAAEHEAWLALQDAAHAATSSTPEVRR
ncbi:MULTISPECIES: hypothetical protein [Streptomyces]|uniref:SAV-6107-like HEPN domain-containing protein n=1 Tax=Streptomyces evansiae TaxID=3075535 RepID=A0ABU2R7Q6_9ACTN|nr:MULTISPECIES: hypothetical protein [unclassified Streptomyces]MDT0412734.1 hypothetical protein [Streptomyces sp. DSM 41979]MYQ56428.1 hypothetical protein [Streptomyces sp. SID4926]SCE48200.1 hypothetical protein GA0115252_152914 [Streptomyces sp. DfronAA-171]